MMKQYIILAIIIFSAGLVSADNHVPYVCLTEEFGCDYELDEDACDGDFIEQPSDDDLLACETGCCVTNGVQDDNVPQYLCEGTWSEGACAEETPICQEGEGDCICNGADLSEPGNEGLVCCSGEAKISCEEEPVEPVEPVDPWIPSDTCGDGVLQDEEVCDYTVDDLSRCPDVADQRCTIACDCAISEEIYNDPEYCSPLNPCDTTPACTGENAPDIFIVEPIGHITGETTAIVSWQSFGGCEDVLQRASLTWQEVDGGDRGSGASVTGYQLNITGLKEETTYNITLNAQFSVGSTTTTVSSPSVLFYTGDKNCLSDRRTYCRGDNLITCDSQNKEVQSTDCQASGQVCAPTILPDQQGYSAQCQPAVDCEACNAGYQALGETAADREINITVSGETQQVACNELSGYDVGGSIAAYCYLDYDQGALKKFKSCNEVIDCTDYQNRNSCEANSCLIGAAAACAWNEQAHVCQSTDPEQVSCDVEGLSPEQCQSISDSCDLIDGTCVDVEEDLTCEIFKSEETCTGGTDFEINPDTHEPTQIAQNEYGLTKCRWAPGAVTNRCVKDSDVDNQPDPGDQRDFTNPETTILTNLSQALPPQPQLTYSVTPQPGGVFTYAYLTHDSCDNVPRVAKAVDEIVDDRLFTFNLYEAVENGTYCLTYYSQDYSRNLEHVKQANITIEVVNPEIIWEDIDVVQITEEVGRVGFKFNLSQVATCDFDLTDQDTYSGTSDKFHFSHDLIQGQYLLDIDCQSERGFLQETRNVFVDFDLTITNPQPPLDTYTPEKILEYQNISIDVNDTGAQCEYRELGTEQWMNFTSVHNITDSEYQQHSTPIPSTEQGFYVYEVGCLLSQERNNQYLRGSRADRIVYAIDDSPPTLTITDSEGEELFGDVVVPEGGMSITITCKDEVIPGLRDEYLNDWSAGNVEIFQNDVAINTGGDEVLTRTLNPEQTILYTCKDAMGYEAEPVLINSAYEDISGPERPEFEVRG